MTNRRKGAKRQRIRSALLAFLSVLMLGHSASAAYINYVPMGLPYGDTSFKTWMPHNLFGYNTPQGRLMRNWSWTDSAGFIRVSGERDLGVGDDYYSVAMGFYYGTTIGTKYRVRTSAGNTFYVILGDAKGRPELNGTGQYGYRNHDIIEFIVNRPYLISSVKTSGNCNSYAPLSGSITEISRMDFVYE